MGLRLIIEDYEGSTTVFPLGEGAVTIGREEGNTIQLTERNISRQHLRLVPSDEGWVLEDLRSYNGVRVNGEVIEQASVIHEGDLIQIGDYQLLIGDETSTRSTMDLGPEIHAAANDAAHAAAAEALAEQDVNKVPTNEDGYRAPVVGPATVPTDEDFDDFESGGGGGKVAVALVLVGALGAGAWFMFGRGDAATGSSAAASTATQAAGDVVEPAANDAGAPAAVEEDAEEAGTPPGDAAEAPDEEAPVEEEAEEAAPVEAEAEEAAPVAEARPAKKRKRTKKAASKPKKSAPAQDEGASAGASAQDLLADARKAQLSKNYAKAYRLAKQSYAAGKSAEAAQLMGVAACKLGDASKAKSAYKKLSGSKKSALQTVCASAGIDL